MRTHLCTLSAKTPVTHNSPMGVYEESPPSLLQERGVCLQSLPAVFMFF